MALREYKGNAKPTSLVADITASATSFQITDPTGWPTGGANGKFFAVFNRNGATEEKVLCLSRSGSTITIDGTGDRGADDTSAATHLAGESVEHCDTATDVREANEHINNAGLDHHTQYMRADGTRHDLTARHAAGSVVPTAVPVAIGTSLAEGSGVNVARANHVHVVGVGAINASNMFAAGVVNNAAMGALAIATGNIQDSAVTTPKIADTSITVAKVNAALYGTGTTAVSNAISHGVSTSFSRTDHTHSTPYTAVIRDTGGGAGITGSFTSMFGSNLSVPAGTYEIMGRFKSENSVAADLTQTARIRNITGGATLDEVEVTVAGGGGTKHATGTLFAWATFGGTTELNLQAMTGTPGGAQIGENMLLRAKRIVSFA